MMFAILSAVDKLLDSLLKKTRNSNDAIVKKNCKTYIYLLYKYMYI